MENHDMIELMEYNPRQIFAVNEQVNKTVKKRVRTKKVRWSVYLNIMPDFKSDVIAYCEKKG